MSEVIAKTIPLPMGGVAHARAIVTNTAGGGTLASFIVGGLPTLTIPNHPGSDIVLSPAAVELSIETASAANSVFWVLNNAAASTAPTVPSATLGFELPKQPVSIWLEPGDFSQLLLIGSAATVNVQCLFYYRRG